MKVLVTGATGFVGSHAVRRLLEDGHAVRVLARTPTKVGPLMEKMGVDPARVEVAEGDITDAGAVGAAVAGCDAVLHAAAVVATDRASEALMESTNLAGTANVFDAAIDAACDPIVHVSSVAALFPHANAVITADDPPAGRGAYGVTKAACDRLARSHQDTGHPLVILYPSGVMGPDDWTESINLPSYKVWLEQGLPTARRFSTSYVDVRDLAELIAATMVPGGGPRRFLATGTHVTARELAAMIESIVGRVRRIPLPQPAFWLWGKAGDLAKRFGIDLVVTSEGYDYMFNTVPGDDAPTTAATGVSFRPLTDTLRDTFVWMHAAGHLEAKHLGALAGSSS